MSHYLRTLRRLEQQNDGDPELQRSHTPTGEETPSAASVSQLSPSTSSIAQVEPASLHVQTAYAALFEYLRAATSDKSGSTVVVAGVSNSNGVRLVRQGLSDEARRQSYRLLVCEVVVLSGNRVLRKRKDREAAKTPSPMHDQPPMELSGTLSETALREWMAQAGVGYDLVLIDAAPMSNSVDGALMARAGDGLVLVVEPGATSKAALDTAVKRAGVAGCTILGVVMVGNSEWQPKWLQRLRSRSPR